MLQKGIAHLRQASLSGDRSYCLFTVTVFDMKSRSAHACVCVCVCVCVCMCMHVCMCFIAIALDETSILVAVHFSMKKHLPVM